MLIVGTIYFVLECGLSCFVPKNALFWGLNLVFFFVFIMIEFLKFLKLLEFLKFLCFVSPSVKTEEEEPVETPVEHEYEA